MISRLSRLFLGALLYCCALAAGSVERVSVCFNYGCLAQAEVVFSDGQFSELRQLLGRTRTPAEEREAIGEAIGRLLGWAGQQSPIAADRGGNFADDYTYGRMDCIDHSTTTTRLLHLMERQGLLRFHRVLEPVFRSRLVVMFPHFAAQIEETEAGEDDGARERFVVDSWFFDNGQPAAVMPLAAWKAGEGPNVDN